MLGAAYASVPLYDLFCRVTGYGGTPQIVANKDAPKTANAKRQITVRFDASLNRNMPWAFNAPPKPMVLPVGAQGLAFYKARNLSAKRVSGTATYNVAPAKVGVYFAKVDCFCFTEQSLSPHEEIDMPVTFFIDPAILEDREMDDVDTITLSYTFFKVPQIAQNTSPENRR